MAENAKKRNQGLRHRAGAEAVFFRPETSKLKWALSLTPVVLALAVLSGCKDATGLSRLKVHVSVNPLEVEGTREPCVNAICVLCKYTINIRTTQGGLADMQWTGSRTVFEFATGTDTLDLSAERSLRRFTDLSPSRTSAQWSWGGPEHLVPVGVTETFYFSRWRDQRPDSASYSFLCR